MPVIEGQKYDYVKVYRPNGTKYAEYTGSFIAHRPNRYGSGSIVQVARAADLIRSAVNQALLRYQAEFHPAVGISPEIFTGGGVAIDIVILNGVVTVTVNALPDGG